jgi:hypothetical protein
LCGGLKSIVRRDEDLILSVVSPAEFRWAVAEIFGRFGQDKYLTQFEGDRSWYWYLIGRGDTDEFFVIDLAPERYGHCYFAYFYFWGQPGSTPVIAVSFQEFLERFHQAATMGEEWSWRNLRLGDAYD